MSEKTREEFSNWYLAEVTQSYGESVRPQAERNLAWVRPDGSFADPMLRLACLAWQASRQLLAPELRNADRYLWLRDSSESVHQFYLSTPIWFTGVKFSKENVDRTIDAAMSAGVTP